MDNKNEFRDIAKKIVFAGIGAIAVAAEAAGGVVDKLSEKGEQVTTESKIINDGKKAVKDLKENVTKSHAKKAMDAVVNMTKEEREALRRKLDEVDAKLNEDENDEDADDEIEVEFVYDEKPEEENVSPEHNFVNDEENNQ